MIQEIFKLLFSGVEFNQWPTPAIQENNAITELRIDAVCCCLRHLKWQQWHAGEGESPNNDAAD